MTQLAELLQPSAIALSVNATAKSALFAEMVALLRLTDHVSDVVMRLVDHREAAGPTAIGLGIAIPHCRSPVIPRVMLAYGRSRDGVDYGAADGAPVRHIFLIAAPPVEVSNDYLPALGALAAGARHPEFVAALDQAASPADVIAALRHDWRAMPLTSQPA